MPRPYASTPTFSELTKSPCRGRICSTERCSTYRTTRFRMAPAKNGNGSLVPAVDRAAQILHAIAASETALGVSELSRQLKFNKSTTHNILNTLCHHHLLERDDSTKTYR